MNPSLHIVALSVEVALAVVIPTLMFYLLLDFLRFRRSQREVEVEIEDHREILRSNRVSVLGDATLRMLDDKVFVTVPAGKEARVTVNGHEIHIHATMRVWEGAESVNHEGEHRTVVTVPVGHDARLFVAGHEVHVHSALPRSK